MDNLLKDSLLDGINWDALEGTDPQLIQEWQRMSRKQRRFALLTHLMIGQNPIGREWIEYLKDDWVFRSMLEMEGFENPNLLYAKAGIQYIILKLEKMSKIGKLEVTNGNISSPDHTGATAATIAIAHRHAAESGAAAESSNASGSASAASGTEPTTDSDELG